MSKHQSPANRLKMPSIAKWPICLDLPIIKDAKHKTKKGLSAEGLKGAKRIC